jgi:hypothetical protein
LLHRSNNVKCFSIVVAATLNIAFRLSQYCGSVGFIKLLLLLSTMACGFRFSRNV